MRRNSAASKLLSLPQNRRARGVLEAKPLDEVLTAMLVHVPENETALRARLEQIGRDAVYTAPEVMRQHWLRVAEALSERFGPAGPDSAWGLRVCDVFAGRTT